MDNIIVDSKLFQNEMIKQNPAFLCPANILDNLVAIQVRYLSFDEKIHIGQIVVNKTVAEDIEGAFNIMLKENFPIQSVIPISDNKFGFDDGISTRANNSSGFNYRYVRETKNLSTHSYGLAIDINPMMNPYVLGERVFPPNSTYDVNAPGTILESSSVVKYLNGLGWRWDGDWEGDLDYQHFEKSI